MKELSKKVINLLRKKKLKISFAESCTGGMLASSITAIKGSSKIFNRAFIEFLFKDSTLSIKINLGLSLNDDFVSFKINSLI